MMRWRVAEQQPEEGDQHEVISSMTSASTTNNATTSLAAAASSASSVLASSAAATDNSTNTTTIFPDASFEHKCRTPTTSTNKISKKKPGTRKTLTTTTTKTVSTSSFLDDDDDDDDDDEDDEDQDDEGDDEDGDDEPDSACNVDSTQEQRQSYPGRLNDVANPALSASQREELLREQQEDFIDNDHNRNAQSSAAAAAAMSSSAASPPFESSSSSYLLSDDEVKKKDKIGTGTAAAAIIKQGIINGLQQEPPGGTNRKKRQQRDTATSSSTTNATQNYSSSTSSSSVRNGNAVNIEDDDGADHAEEEDDEDQELRVPWRPQTVQSTCEFTHTIADYAQKRESGCKKAEYSNTTVDEFGNRWRLIVYVNGNGRASNHHLSLFLQVADADDLPFGWKKAVSYVLTLEHPSGGSFSYAKRNPDKTFKLCPKAIDWGWSQFITSDRIQQEGFVLNDSLTVRASVTVKSSSVSIDSEDSELYLKCAVEEGDAEAVRLCLDHGASVNCQFKDDLYTPLHTACSSGTNNGSMEVLNLLLSEGADCNACNKWRETPLLIAANNGHRAAVQALLKHGANPSLCSEAGWSALTFAAHKGYDDIVALLLHSGAPVKCPVTEDSSTPLHKACAGSKPGHLASVKLLVEAGADVHALNKWRETPLLTAANHGQAGAVEVLLAAGADPCKCTDTGWSPLSIAAYKGHDEVVRLLLEEGAPTEEDDPTLSALLQAATKGLPDTVELLLRHGADHTVTTKKGDTALSILVEQNLIDAAVEMVTAYNASIPRCSRDRKKVQRARLLINLRMKQLEREGKNAVVVSSSSDESVEGTAANSAAENEDGEDGQEDNGGDIAANMAQHQQNGTNGIATQSMKGREAAKKKGKGSKMTAEEKARAAEEALLLELEEEDAKAKRVEAEANSKRIKKKKKKERERQQKMKEEQERKEREEREAMERDRLRKEKEEKLRLEREQKLKEQREQEFKEMMVREKVLAAKRKEREEREQKEREEREQKEREEREQKEREVKQREEKAKKEQQGSKRTTSDSNQQNGTQHASGRVTKSTAKSKKQIAPGTARSNNTPTSKLNGSTTNAKSSMLTGRGWEVNAKGPKGPKVSPVATVENIASVPENHLPAFPLNAAKKDQQGLGQEGVPLSFLPSSPGVRSDEISTISSPHNSNHRPASVSPVSSSNEPDMRGLSVEHPAVSLYRRQRIADLVHRCTQAFSMVDELMMKRVLYRWITRAAHSKDAFVDPMIPSWTDHEMLVAFIQRQFISNSHRGGGLPAGMSMESLKEAGSSVAMFCQTVAKEVSQFEKQLPADWTDSSLNMTATESALNGFGSAVVTLTWSNQSQTQVSSSTFASLRERYSGSSNRFVAAVFVTKIWYETLGLVVADTTMDLVVPGATKASLARELQVNAELWSDPLTSLAGNIFWGRFVQVDSLFEGQPPFGQNEFGDQALSQHGGSLMVVPPQDSMVAARYIRRMVDVLDAAGANGVPLSFTVFIPADCWHDNAGGPSSINDLRRLDSRLCEGKSSYVRRCKVLQAGKHLFETMSSAGDGHPTATTCYTRSLFVVLQNDAGSTRLSVDDDVEARILSTMLVSDNNTDGHLPASSGDMFTGLPASHELPLTNAHTYFDGLAPLSPHAQQVVPTELRTLGGTPLSNAFSPAVSEPAPRGTRRGRLFDLVDDGEEDPIHDDVDLVSGMLLKNLDVGLFQSSDNVGSADIDIEAISLMGINGPTPPSSSTTTSSILHK